MAPKNPDTRKQAVIALSLASSQGALFDQLEQMLQDKDVEVRETVAASLGEVYTLIALTRPKIGSTFVRKPRSPRMKITQFLAATLLSRSAAFAQIQTGRIAGTVYDPNKAVVPNATVIVTNTETKVAQKVLSKSAGDYVVPALNPGIYEIHVSASGFRTVVQNGVEMQVGKDLLLDFDLTLGETSSVIEVNSTVPLLNSESGESRARHDEPADCGSSTEWGAPLGSPNSTIVLTPEYTHMRMGYDQHWNFGIQQQLSKTMVADIEYVGNKGSNIQANNGFNIPAPAAGGVQARRQFPRFGAFSYISSDTSTTYHAMQVKLERRFSGGLWLLGSYTFSKSLWNTNTPSVGGMFAFEKGPSVRQRCDRRVAVAGNHVVPQRRAVHGLDVTRCGQHRCRRTAAQPHRVGQVGQPDAGAVVQPGGFRGRAQLHVWKLRPAHPLAGHSAHGGFLVVQAVPDRRARAIAAPLGGVQSSEYTQLCGSQLDVGHGHRGAGHQHRYRAAANAGSLEADILTP
jgi:hypothetical protein